MPDYVYPLGRVYPSNSAFFSGRVDATEFPPHASSEWSLSGDDGDLSVRLHSRVAASRLGSVLLRLIMFSLRYHSGGWGRPKSRSSLLVEVSSRRPRVR